MNVVTPKLRNGHCRLATYGTLEMADVPSAPLVIRATPNELMTTPNAKNANRCGMLFIWYASSSSVSRRLHLRPRRSSPRQGQAGTYQKHMSRQTGHPFDRCLIFTPAPVHAYHVGIDRRMDTDTSPR